MRPHSSIPGPLRGWGVVLALGLLVVTATSLAGCAIRGTRTQRAGLAPAPGATAAISASPLASASPTALISTAMPVTAAPSSTMSPRDTATAIPSATSANTATASPTVIVASTATRILTPSVGPSRAPTTSALGVTNPNVRRFGLNFIQGYGALSDYPLARAGSGASLPFGWYSDYQFQSRPQTPGGVEYAQMVPASAKGVQALDRAALRAAILVNPGALWLVGNEPECIYQDNQTPEAYATVYHDYYVLIKGIDPTARLAIGGVVQPTPLRLQWLDRVLQHYRALYKADMPVDVWNIHNMILPELRGGYGSDIPVGIAVDRGESYPWDQSANVAIFESHIVAFRRWMAARGERDKPLIISEYGVLYPCSYWDTIAPPRCADRVNAYMEATFDYMLRATDTTIGYPADGNRLVQAWSWFSMNCPSYEQVGSEGFNGNLSDPLSRSKALTPFGEHYARVLERVRATGRAK